MWRYGWVDLRASLSAVFHLVGPRRPGCQVPFGSGGSQIRWKSLCQVWAGIRGGCEVSITVRQDATEKPAIAAINEHAWIPIEYPNAVFDLGRHRQVLSGQPFQPAASDNATAGTNPTAASRFASSNTADTARSV